MGSKNLLQIARGNQVLIFGILSKEVRDIGAERDNGQLMGAREIEHGTRELRGQTAAFKRRRNLRMRKHDAIGQQAIGEQRAKPVYRRFESAGYFIVRDNYVVEVKFHRPPRPL